MSGSSILRRLAIVALIAVLILLSFSVSPGKARPLPIPSASTTVPTQVFPLDGSVLPIKRIIYIWAAVPNATQYQLLVFRDTTQILSRALGATICISGTCAYRHDLDLADGNYNWKIRATVAGVAQPYSPSQYFAVSVPLTGFYSPFTTEAVGWFVHKGLWNLESSNYFTTLGVARYAATISHQGNYNTLTYEVRMKRAGCVSCANVIAIRGNPELDATGWWNTEYTFDYTNNGYISVWRDSYGTYTPLLNWTYSSAIVQGGWNTLKVKADGPYLYFYINNTLVWSGYDGAYPSGRVGIGMYRNATSTGDKLYVDFARLDTFVTYTPEMPLTTDMEPPIESLQAPSAEDKNMAP